MKSHSLLTGVILWEPECLAGCARARCRARRLRAQGYVMAWFGGVTLALGKN